MLLLLLCVITAMEILINMVNDKIFIIMKKSFYFYFKHINFQLSIKRPINKISRKMLADKLFIV